MILKKLGLALLIALFTLNGASASDVLVFAAASTTNALDEIGALFEARGLGHLKASYAASSTLAKQIEQGAPADIFVSADTQWMAYLDSHALVDHTSILNLLGNELVLVAPQNSNTSPLTITPTLDLSALIGNGRLSTGDPDHVPVGIYAKQALEKLGQWSKLEPKLARADSVRSALVFVELGEAPLGIVYATDAAQSPKVKVVGHFPTELHDPILYPAALIAGRATPTARAFFDFMQSTEAKAIWRKYGFKVN